MSSSQEPRIGVVVPCRNEIATIERCLQALRAQQPPLQHVVVVDNGSTDGSLDVARSLADVTIELPGATISQMRNTGARHVGEVDYLGFVDADCEVASDWTRVALAALEGADIVGSRTLASPDARWVAARWAAVERHRAHGDSLLWSQHLLLRRGTFEGLGGFDETMATGEDADLSARVRAGHGVVAICPDLVTIHHGFPPTVRDFLRRERWHTSTPGWLARMAPKSRLLVYAVAAWAALGVVTTVSALVGGSAAGAAGWLLSAVVGLPALGWLGGARSPRHCLQDGVLIGLWALLRSLRLPSELVATGRTLPAR